MSDRQLPPGLTGDLDVLAFAEAELAAGRPAALITIVSLDGPFSRPLGAQLAVAGDKPSSLGEVWRLIWAQGAAGVDIPLLVERQEIGDAIKKLVDGETNGWGLDVKAIKIQDIEVPDDLKRIMSRQAAAEREKRANIIKSEGDKEAAKNLADAAKMMERSKGAMQLRTLQTLDGLGPQSSNTVVMALPVEVLEWFKKGR